MSRIKQFLLPGIATISVVSVVAVPALAVGRPTATPSASPAATPAVQTRLAEAKLKVCQNHEAAIQKRSDQLVKLATTMQDNFTSIASRVKTYYTSTVVPSGKKVDNYDTLLSAIATKQSAATTALAKTQGDATAFSCTSDNPKGQLTQFRTDMQAVKQALKDYRTSIKDLIVAIRSVTGKTGSSANPTVSPASTASPTT